MGFWAPHTLVADARRHGVVVLGPDANKSEAGTSLEPGVPPEPGTAAGPAVRIGLASVKGVGTDLAEKIAAGRPVCGHGGSRPPERHRPVRSRGTRHLRSPRRARPADGRPGTWCRGIRGAGTGAGGTRGRPLTRRGALWAAGAAAEARPDRLPGTVIGTDAPRLPEMTEIEVMSADLQTLGLSPGSSPMALAREGFAARGVVPNAELVRVPDGAKVLVAGVVTHRQRPATAGGTHFSTWRTRRVS